MASRSDTRAALQAAALALFTERGYDQTPTALVAERAGVSEMTLFRHFRSKAALLVEDPYDPVIVDLVAGRPVEEGPWQAAVRGFAQAVDGLDGVDVAGLRQRLRIALATPGLAGALAAGGRDSRDAVAAALVERGARAREAAVIAAAVVAGLDAALHDWALAPAADLRAALRAALGTLGER